MHTFLYFLLINKSQICKFHISCMVNGREMSEQSEYINPPLSGMLQTKHSQKNDKTNQSLNQQFPITFQSILIRQNDKIEIKLVQLTKNGRQKQIGYSRIVINHQVINKATKHKIMKAGQTFLQGSSNANTINGEILSIIQLSIQSSTSIQSPLSQPLYKNTNTSTTTTPHKIILKADMPSYTLEQQQSQQQQQQQNQDDNDNSQQLDENVKFDYNDQEGYLYDNNNNDNNKNGYKLNGENTNDISVNASEGRNLYIVNGEKNNSNKTVSNQQKSKKNIFNQSVMNTRYGGRMKTYISVNNQTQLQPQGKNTRQQQQQILSAGKIYKQQKFAQNNKPKNNFSHIRSKREESNRKMQQQKSNISKSYQRKEIVDEKRLNESSLVQYNGTRIQQQQKMNNISNNNNKQSRRYLVQQQQKRDNNDNHNQSTQHNNDLKMKSFSDNTKNLTHNDKTNKTKRRFKYIFSNNQLRYLTNEGVVVGDRSIEARNKGSWEQNRGQRQKTIGEVFGNDDKINGISKNERILARSPIFVGSQNQYHKADEKTPINKQQKPNRPIKNVNAIKTPSLNPTRQHATSILEPQLPLQDQPLLQYFITQNETNPQGCYILKNIHVVYEVSSKNSNQKNIRPHQQQFKPKFITFLTYNLYEKVVRVNCLSKELGSQKIIVKRNNYSSNKVKYLDAKESSNFILKSPQGEIKPSAVCDTFAHLQLLLPKYCLIFRVQIIMQDESIFIGTLANQLGQNIKSTLHLKKTLHSHNNTSSTNFPYSSFQSINLVVDICDLNSNQKRQGRNNDLYAIDNKDNMKDLQKSKNEGVSQNSNIFDNSKSHTLDMEQTANRHGPSIEKSLSFVSPSRRKQFKQSTIQYLPNINLIEGQLSGNQSDGKLIALNDFITKNNDKIREQSPIQKTLNAITAYKICLSPMTGPVYEQNKDQINKNSLHYRTGQNYHINFDSFNKNGQKSPQYQRERQKRNHILLQKQENSQINDDLNNSADDSDLQYLMRRGISDLGMKQTLSKDLPKIMIHRSNLRPINSKKQTFKNAKEEFSSIINKRNKSTSQDQFSYKNQVRLEFFKKILGNRYLPSQHKNSSIQSLKHNKNPSKRSHSKSKISPNEKRNQMVSKRYKKLKTLPYCDLNSTKVFSNDAKSKYHKHSKLSVSPHKQTKKHTYARQLKCLKDHCMSNSSLLTLKQRQQAQLKNLTTYRVSIRKIDFLKLLDNRQNQYLKRQKNYGTDNDQSDIELNKSQSFIENSQNCQVFIKLFNESKKKKQFITSTQGLKPTFGQKTTEQSKRKDPKSPQELDYLSCSWILASGQFLFKKIKLDNLITVEAYGDLASVDNHEFLGKCIFSVQQMLFLKYQKKITGYMVKQKSIKSHVTVHFEIEENND